MLKKIIFVPDTTNNIPLQNIIDDIDNYLSNKENNILIEEKLEGQEFSLLSFVDSKGNLSHLHQFLIIKSYLMEIQDQIQEVR